MPERDTYLCHRATTPIVIDGLLDDPAWAQAVEVSLVQAASGQKTRQATTARVLWDDAYLYISFHCQDTRIYASLRERGMHLWDEEVVEVFLDDDCDDYSYAEFEVNPLNTILELFLFKRGEVWKQLWEWQCPRMRTTVRVDGDPTDPDSVDRSWTVEIALPWEDFCTAPHLPPQVGDRWRMNLYRIDRAPEGDEYSAWSAPRRNAFHTPERFGWLEFVE
ncbi:MAG: carbohydrate-binding family 9-like protein [Anaerolineae bacterium]